MFLSHTTSPIHNPTLILNILKVQKGNEWKQVRTHLPNTNSTNLPAFVLILSLTSYNQSIAPVLSLTSWILSFHHLKLFILREVSLAISHSIPSILS